MALSKREFICYLQVKCLINLSHETKWRDVEFLGKFNAATKAQTRREETGLISSRVHI